MSSINVYRDNSEIPTSDNFLPALLHPQLFVNILMSSICTVQHKTVSSYAVKLRVCVSLSSIATIKPDEKIFKRMHGHDVYSGIFLFFVINPGD